LEQINGREIVEARGHIGMVWTTCPFSQGQGSLRHLYGFGILASLLQFHDRALGAATSSIPSTPRALHRVDTAILARLGVA